MEEIGFRALTNNNDATESSKTSDATVNNVWEGSSQPEGNVIVVDEDSKGDEDEENDDEVWEVEALHRQLITSIFEIGVVHATPSILHRTMRSPPDALTGDRVKSHLQKFRKTLKKERERFVHEFDRFLGLCHEAGEEGGDQSMTGLEEVLGGKAVAHATYCIMQRAKRRKLEREKPQVNEEGSPLVEEESPLALPVMTEEEKESALGASLIYIQGCVEHMTKHISEEREAKWKRTESAKATSARVPSPVPLPSPKQGKVKTPTNQKTLDPGGSRLPDKDDTFEPLSPTIEIDPESFCDAIGALGWALAKHNHTVEDKRWTVDPEALDLKH